ncbi:hypothetical protein ACTFIU_000021 [Dictyostelium citrinum]
MEAATNTLRSMFPKSSADQCVSALKINNWDLSATIDYMLAQTATEEQQVQQQQVQQQVQQQQVQQQVNPSIPPPPHTIPPPLPPQPASVVESEEDKLLKEFLFLEQQIQINRIPTPPPYNPSTNNNVAIKPSVAVVEKVEPISIPPPPPPQPIVHEHPPQQQQQQEQQEQQEEEPKTRENNSLLRNITNTLKELENEVRNLVMEKKPSQSNVVETVESLETTETVISNNDINNNNNVAQNNTEQLVEKEQQVEQEQVEQEQVGQEQENNENHSNNNSQLPNEVKVAIDQLESLFNSSLEKTEKILNELKEEITSWKIKDNVKTFTVTVRNELSDILASLANYISPDQTEVQIQRKEAKRQELENKLKELKEHNRILEEERRIAIEKIENKYKQQQTTTTTTTSSDNQIPPPPPYPEDNSEQ